MAQGLLELEAASWTGFANDQYSEDAPFDILRFGARAVANQDSVGRLVSIRVCTRSGNPTLSNQVLPFLPRSLPASAETNLQLKEPHSIPLLQVQSSY